MKKPENEIIYDRALEAVDEFTKEFNGINREPQEGIQEVWESGLINKDITEQQAGNV